MEIISVPKTKHVIDVEVGLLSGEVHTVTLQTGDTVERSGPELIIRLKNPTKQLYYLLTPGMWYSEQQREVVVIEKPLPAGENTVIGATLAEGGATVREEPRSLRIG